MGVKLFGLVIIAVGFTTVLVSFRLDQLGLGRYAGVGKEQFLLTGLGGLICLVGVLFVVAPRDPRPR